MCVNQKSSVIRYGVCMCVGVYGWMCVCACACVYVCVHECVRVGVCE